MKVEGLQEFLDELETHCYSTAIATFTGSDGTPFVVDLQRQQSQKVTYGYQSGIKDLFMAHLINRSKPAGSLVLRSFTAEIDQLTKLPFKELRGYTLRCLDSQFEFQKISAEIMFACQNTDANTGEVLPLEQAVRYC